MAALVLSIAGGAAGAAFGPIGAFAGRLAGAVAGNMIDRSLFGSGNIERSAEGPRLSDLEIMASREGAPIARVYGRARLSGQMIWATELEEVITRRVETTNAASGGGGGGGKGFGGGGTSVTTTTTTYSYFANFAVGLCEGPIGRIGRVWADGKLLDTSGLNFRVHPGTEEQTADDLIVAKEGAANAPAYRGLAYVVFERLPLANFGNRIPQLAFEIVRPIGELEERTRAVTLIPGTSEFGYETATVVQVLGPGRFAPENRHVSTAPSDVIAALDDLQAACPRLERIAVVVAWFGDDLRAGHCKLRPGVDSAVKVTHGATWQVSDRTRDTAYLVSTVEGRPAFGGTPSDASVVNLIAEIKARGLKVTLYPFVMMDIPADNALPDPWTGAGAQPAYPWRGRITCDPAPGQPGSVDGTALAGTQVDAFFEGAGPQDWSYRRMVLHYALLAVQAGGVDAFLIGSELKALTRVRSSSGVYPAVDQLIALAADVKAIGGAGTIVTYGADWTEYGAHVVDIAADEVRFPLDRLWASAGIDCVGIDYYAPLADWRDGASHLDVAIASGTHDRAYLSARMRSGEAYDWYYADAAARQTQARTLITDALGKPWTFRAKDIWAWWATAHVERVGGAELAAPTDWVPQSKPVWLTEVGCPAVDKGANQPSVFPDPKSSEAGLPYFSNGQRDDLIQRRYLEAVLDTFDPDGAAAAALNPTSVLYAGRMIDISAVHLWTWDARPFPAFPAASDAWSDAGNWERGHWLTGRFGGAPLDELVGALLADCGVGDANGQNLGQGPDGYVVDRPMSARSMLEPLAQAYAFDAQAIGGVLQFRGRGGGAVVELEEDDLVLPENGALARLVRGQETELPREVTFGFTDGANDYRRAAVMSRRLVGAAARGLHADYAVVTDDGAAAQRAEIWLQDMWAGREHVEFSVSPRHLAMTPGDVIGVTISARRRLVEILEIVDTQARRIKARSIDPDVFLQPLGLPQRLVPAMPPALAPVLAHVLDLPTLDASDPPVLTRLAVYADPWPGGVTVWRSADGQSFAPFARASAPGIVGETLDPLGVGPTSRWDRAGTLRVHLPNGALASVTDGQLLDGGNVAAIRHDDGQWEILQFANAELVDTDTYRLSRLLRGQAGSDFALQTPAAAGAPFVLLDNQMIALARGLDELGRPIALRLVASGRAHDDPAVLPLDVTPQPNALKPLSPVHVKARRDPGGILLSWIRRTRRDGDGWSAEVPLGEDVEAYELDVMDGGTVIRTFGTAAPQLLYAASDELADFGAPQVSLSVTLYQISATVGRGFPLAVTLSV